MLSLWPVARDLKGRIPSLEGVSLLPPLLGYEKDNLAARLIQNFKYRGQTYTGRYLARQYADRLSSSGLAGAYEAVLPVPMHWWRLSRRGFNQSTVIARVLSQRLGIPLLANLLRRTRYTRQQVGMDQKQRWSNVKDKFALRNREPILGKKLLLVDDVLTTGATSLSCAQLLLEGGAQRIGICALALRV